MKEKEKEKEKEEEVGDEVVRAPAIPLSSKEPVPRFPPIDQDADSPNNSLVVDSKENADFEGLEQELSISLSPEHIERIMQGLDPDERDEQLRPVNNNKYGLGGDERCEGVKVRSGEERSEATILPYDSSFAARRVPSFAAVSNVVNTFLPRDSLRSS